MNHLQVLINQPNASQITFKVHLIPNSKKNELISEELIGSQLNLKIKLTAIPEDNKANQHLIKFIAKSLKIAPSKIQIISGHNQRHKLLSIQI